MYYLLHKVTLLFICLMWTPLNKFATFVKNQYVLKTVRKKMIKRDVFALYSSLHVSQKKQVQGISSFFTFFQWPMTTTRLAMYAISIFAFTTWAYAMVAPHSFARVTAWVQTLLKNAIETSLETVGLKANNELKTDTSVRTESDVWIDADTRSQELGDRVLVESDTRVDTDTKVDMIVELDTDTKIQAGLESDAEVWVDTAIKYIGTTVHDAGIKWDLVVDGMLDGKVNDSGSTTQERIYDVEVLNSIGADSLIDKQLENKKMDTEAETLLKSSSHSSIVSDKTATTKTTSTSQATVELEAQEKLDSAQVDLDSTLNNTVWVGL